MAGADIGDQAACEPVRFKSPSDLRAIVGARKDAARAAKLANMLREDRYKIWAAIEKYSDIGSLCGVIRVDNIRTLGHMDGVLAIVDELRAIGWHIFVQTTESSISLTWKPQASDVISE